MRFALLALVFVIVMAIVILMSNAYARRAATRSRLDEVRGQQSRLTASASLRGDTMAKGWHKLTAIIEKSGISLVDTQGDSLRARLVAAGYNSPLAPKVFTAIRLGMLVVLPTIFVSVVFLGGTEVSPFKLYLFGVALAIFGLYAPNLFISAKADRRRDAIVNGFPDSLDLMLVCVEAGLGMEAAFDRVGREMQNSHPLVAEMLSIVTLELRAGSTREEALRNMATRTQVTEIRSFATLLIQSDKLGSSIGETLRVYASEMREKRRMRAEEKAHRLPVLLSVPLVACMLPVMIGVLMLPAIIRLVREMLPAMSGG
ncbi:type II secretion system F family protein [Sphingorhabdus sp.]|jgi:tight adherence protein C|uniref:type II secretion system F family protein n=1 Tax=Sphingorhabdus sp. TaxID=1902408 RepID=UPI003D8173BC